MEICDVVDASGTRTGRMVVRDTKLATGEYYLVVHVWIKDENHNYLIQQRALHLASNPGVWATTVGYVLTGEESVEGAIREVSDELGLQLSPNQLHQTDRHVLDNRVEDVWMAVISREMEKGIELGDEVADCKWVSRETLEELVDRGKVFRYSYHGRFF